MIVICKARTHACRISVLEAYEIIRIRRSLEPVNIEVLFHSTEEKLKTWQQFSCFNKILFTS